MRVARRVVGLFLFVVFTCRLYRRGSNCVVRLTALALTLCTCLSAMRAQEVRSQMMHHHVRHEVTDNRAAFMGRLPDNTQMHLSVILPLRNQAALNGLLQRLYDRSSPDYHHFLTVAQFTEQFGPTEDDYAAVATYLSSYGLKVEAAPANRLIVPLSGSAAQVNAAFNVRMSTYQHPTENRTFFSPDREPSMGLNVPIWHIAGLDNFSTPRHFMHRKMADQAAPLAVNGSGPGNSYLGSDMRAAYYGGTTLDGTGQAVGLLEFGGYDMTDVTLTFGNAGQTTNVPINNVLLDGATGGPEGPYGDGEQVLDIVQAIGMAPGLSQVRVYIGFGQDDANILNSMASENIAKQLSCSWGWLPADPTADDVFFEEMAAQGQSFFAASGDDGAFDAAIDPYFYPAEDQYVTTVGGTHLTTSGPGGAWVSETVWNSEGAGSGGGISPDGITQPSYQNGLVTTANGGSTTLRNEPDVAMEADFDNYICQAHACSGDWAGTSFAAPRWAGFMALVNQQAVEAGTAPSGGIGFLNPPLYQLAQGANADNDLHDIVSGNNETDNQPVWFSAVAGYDLTTGWGSANGQSLIDDLAGPQVPGFWLTSLQSTLQLPIGGTGTTTIKITDAGGFTSGVNLAVTSTLPSGVTASFASNPATALDVLTFSAGSSVVQQDIPVTVTGTSGSLTQSANLTLSIHTPTFALVTSSNGFNLNPGNTVTATITVVPEYGFTGSVNLSIAGLPSGVTASFSPTSTTGTSTMTLTASVSAAGGTYTPTITGTSGSITATTTLKLAVTGPQFLLYAGSVTVGQGSSASTYVEVYPENGFSGSVTLAATNLPAGVTATFLTNPTTNTSSVTFTASNTTPAGQSTVTITGISGALTASTSITLNVMAPTFVLSSGGSVTVGQGGSGSSYVYVTDEYGFTGNVALSVSGLPRGVTALWTTNPTTSNSSLYLYVTNSVTPGLYPLTITGTSGSLTQTTTLNLTVAAPTFTLISSGSITSGTGTTVSGWVDINRLYGFTGSVTLLASGMPSGVTVSFSPNTLTGTAYNSSMTINTGASTAPGQYPLTITGVSGGQTVTTSLTLTVSAPTFTLFSGSVTVGQGLSGTSYVYVSQLYGFTGAVTLSASGLPNGVTASFSPNPTTAYSNLATFNVSSSVAAGQYPITITGTSGSLIKTTTMTLVVGVPSFTLSAYQLTVGQGQTSTTAVYINDVNGFDSPVTLSVSGLPSGVTAILSPNPTTSYYNQLTFTVNSSVAAGQYPLTITGTSGSLTQTTTMTLTVAAPSFTLYGAYAPTIGLGSTGAGYVYVQQQNGFNGNVSLSISGLPSGVTASFGTNPTTYSSSIQFAAASTAAVGTSTLTITGTYGSEVQTITMSLTVGAPTFSLYGPYNLNLNQGGSATSSVTVSPLYGFTGSVNLSASGLPSGVTAAFSPNPTTGTSTVTLTATSTASPGTTTFTITGTSGSITNSITAQVIVNMGDFSLAAAPNRVFVAPGAASKSTLSVVPVNGFANGVNLAVSGLPAGVTATFSPTIATTSSTLTLTADTSAPAGSSTVTVTGTSGSATNSTSLLLTVTNGGAVAASTTLALTANGNAVSTVAQGTMVTATATVDAGANPVTAGQVYLCDAGVSYCDSVQQIATAQLNNNGNAVFRFIPRTVVGAYKAVFAGTTGILTSSSASTPLTVTASLPTTTVLAQSGTAGNYTLTATVTAQGPVAPTGSVSFNNNSANNTVLTSAALGSSTPKLTEAIAQTIPVGPGAAFTASGDFNGDGIPDLAVSNALSTTVSILLGNNRGTFTAGTTLQIGATPSWIAVGDFNRDGNVDLAVVVSANSTVLIYLGNGDGTFTASTTPLFTLPQPTSIVVADMNGDGLQDLAVLSQNGYVTVLLGHGDGTFTPSVFGSSPGGILRSFVQADFNGDGVADLAIANESYPGGLTILLGSGDGSFTVASTISSATPQYVIAVGDFNHDGKPDLAAGSDGALAVYLGNGDGTFTQTANALSTGYIFSLAVADINNDGNLDLIAADVNSAKIITLLGKGDGTFSTAAAVPVSGQPEGLIVGDWNGDGVLDIGVANYDSNSVTIITSQLAQTVTAIASNLSPNQPGQNTIQANYQGDNSYASSTSGTVTLTGNKVTPTVTLMPSSSAISTSAPLTVSVQVTYSISSSVPSGTIVLTSGSFTSASVALVSGSGTITVPAGALVVGTDTLTVSYTPDSASAALYNAATGTGAVSVSQAIPTITWATPASIPYGTALSGAQLNAIASTAGTFSYNLAAGTILHVGQHTLSVTFTPTDTANYQSATSSVVLNVAQVPLSVSANNVSRIYGTANPTFTGSVTGAVNGDTFTETFLTTATNSSQTSTYAIVPSVSGADLTDYTITMTNGTLTILPAPTTITWRTPVSIAYGTALSVMQLNATSSTAGTFSYTPAAGSVLQAGPNTLSVTFTPTDSTNYQSATGSVLITVNKVPLSIGANDKSRTYGAANPTFSGSVNGAVNGDTFTETFSTSATNTSPVGTYTIVPSVNGANLADYTVTATNGTLTVLASSNTITWATPASIPYGTALSGAQLNATSSTAGTFSYSPASGTVLPPGQHTLSVTFTPTDTTDYQSTTSSVLLIVNKAPLSISANNLSRVYGTANPTFSGALTGAVNGDTFTETFSTSATTLSQAGTYAIVPLVNGANLADYTVATTNGTLTILPASTTTTFALSNQNLTVTATVSSTSAGAPTGPVMFYAGQTLLGTGTLSGGTASISLTSFPSGDVSLRAQYGGDGNFSASTSTSIPLLTFAAGSPTLTVTSSGTATDNFSIGVLLGYSGALQFSCSGLPQNTSCSFLPASVTFSGTATTASTMLTLTTGGTAQMDSTPLKDMRAHAILLATFALPGLLPLMITRRRRLIARLPTMSVLLLLCSACVWFMGCGGGGGKSSGSVTAPVAPSGNYTIQVMASGPAGLSTSTAIALTVQ